MTRGVTLKASLLISIRRRAAAVVATPAVAIRLAFPPTLAAVAAAVLVGNTAAAAQALQEASGRNRGWLKAGSGRGVIVAVRAAACSGGCPYWGRLATAAALDCDSHAVEEDAQMSCLVNKLQESMQKTRPTHLVGLAEGADSSADIDDD